MASYFAFAQKASDEKSIKLFFFKLTNQDRIREAREILADTTKFGRSVSGTIIPKTVPYNPEWAFHLDPASIQFFSFQAEVCDANVTYVADHLSEIGGSTLPKSFWCPWSSRLIAEVTHLVDQVTEKLEI
jgi:hypothetical protein